MRALSLTQPWATLVALGAKRLETRSWSTDYRGQLAIHATREVPHWSEDDEVRDVIDAVLTRFGYETSEGLKSPAALLLPRSAILASCELVTVFDAAATVGAVGLKWFRPEELLFGDFTAGRFAWGLEDVQRLATPLPARGYQGLWTPSRELAHAIAAQVAA